MNQRGDRCRWWGTLSLLTALTGLLQFNVHALANPKIEIVPAVGHAGSVYFAAFSPDGARVVSGSLDKTLKLWDVASGRLIRTFLGHTGDVNEVRFSHDGTRLISGSSDRTLKLWDVATGQLVRTFDGHSDAVSSVMFSPDAVYVLSASANTVWLWETGSGRLVRTFQGHSDSLSSVAFSPDGTLVLSASGDKVINLWHASSGRLLRSFRGHTDRVRAIAFSPDGTRILSGSKDSTARLWNATTGEVVRTFAVRSTEMGISSVAFSHDGRHALIGDQWGPGAVVWEIATGRRIYTLKGHSSSVYSVAFSPDGKSILSGSEDRTLKLWDAATGKLIKSLGGQIAGVGSVVFSRDGRRVISVGGATSAMLWDATNGQLIRALAGRADEANDVTFSPDGNRILIASSDVTLWDVATGQLIRTFEAPKTSVMSAIRSVAFSPDGRRIVSGTGSRFGTPIESDMQSHLLNVWDGETGAVIHTLVGHSNWISSVAFSADGSRILTGSEDRTVKLWDAATGQLIRTFQGHMNSVTSVAFSPDGTRIASGSGWLNWGEERKDNAIRIWDPATGDLVRSLEGHEDTTWSVAFSPDGTRLLSGGMDDAVKLWDAETGQLIRTLKGHAGWVFSVAFSPQGDRLLSGSNDGTIKIWNPATGGTVASMLGNRVGEWLAMTEGGFFAASPKASEMLSIVRGLEPTLIDQVHQSLFNPDLVREMLSGDPDGEVARAGKVIDLTKVLESGPAPEVAITSPLNAARSSTDLVTFSARIVDRGRGIGRIEWRINGITAAVAAKRPARGPAHIVTQQLPLDRGDNIVEVVAYNASNLLASVPARTTIKLTAPADPTKPKLHILAIGINAYVDRGSPLHFGPLSLAVKDATAFGATMKKAAAGLYDEVRVTLAMDNDATRDNLDRFVNKIARQIHPRDSFILFAAGHGTSENGRFYFIPQDYQTGPGNLERSAIGQDLLQDWLGNRIKAKRVIVLLDTCESGALVAGHARSRVDAPASDSAVGRLHEATGRPVLTAAAAGQFAHEGLIGASGDRHGVFTWAVLDALRKGDTNGNGNIELSELVRHVQSVVPKVAADLGGEGRAATSEPIWGKQAARFGSRGEDFIVAQRLH